MSAPDPATLAKLAAMDARMRVIRRTCPPDVTKYGHAVVGYILNKPVKGSGERKCDNCGDPTIIDPNGLLILATLLSAKPLCAPCGMIVLTDHQGQPERGPLFVGNFNPLAGRSN